MRRARSGLGILLSFIGASSAAELQEKAAFHSNAYVVLINATVLDRDSRPVRGLTRDNFRLFQDKAQRPISYFGEEEVPLSLAIVFDTSGSEDEYFRRAQGSPRAACNLQPQ